MRRISAIVLSLSYLLWLAAGIAAQDQPFKNTPARPATAAGLVLREGQPETPEARTERALEAARGNDGTLYAFLREMPKGGDLHNHDVGAVYAENWIAFAAESKLCVDRQKLALARPPCAEGQVDAGTALSDPILYREMIDAFSMRNARHSGQNGHDHFFDTFGKFGAAKEGHMGLVFAELAQRASRGHLQYLELMTTADRGESIGLGAKLSWDHEPSAEELAAARTSLLGPEMEAVIAHARKNLDDWYVQRDQALQCDAAAPAKPEPGCSVTTRHIYPVLRAFPPGQVFSQMVFAFELASRDKRYVGVNMVQPEDAYIPMHDFHLHMRMMGFLKELYPMVHVSLHAGELAPGLVPPDGLGFHIRESVEIGRAERIGHGVDVLYEDNPHELLAELARRNVLVEICLGSNDAILGVKGRQHPLAAYLKAGVPVALATDDEGVSRSDITHEYMRAVQDQNLDYVTLKRMARYSLEHSFLAGTSLWQDGRKFATMRECSPEHFANPGPACQKLLSASDRAREQWRLEKEFADFEARFKEEPKHPE